MNEQAHIHVIIGQLAIEYSADAIRALESCGESAIAPLLDALLRPDIDPYGHDAFAEALVKILLGRRHPQTANLLVVLLEHQNADVRRRAIYGLGASGDRLAVHILRITLYDRNDLVGKAAAEALIQLLYGPPGVDSFAAALRDSEARVRYYAVRQLEQMQATDRLIAATDNEDRVVRRIAIWYLARARVAHAAQVLIHALQDSDIEVRGGAVYALGNLGDARAVKVLLPLLDDPEAVVVQLTGDALFKLGYASTA